MRVTSIPPSPGAPRPRERERMGVLSLGIMDSGGIWRKWKEQNASTRKQKNQKKIGTSRELGEIRRRKRTNQKVGIKRKKKEHRSRGNEREKRTNQKVKKLKRKSGNPPKIGRPGSRPTKEKIEPRKVRSSARRRRLGIAGIGVTGRCA